MVLAAEWNDSGANLSTALQYAHDCHFVLGSGLSDTALANVLVHETCRATDEGFVHFDLATRPSHFHQGTRLHRQTDAVEHEPCGLLSDAQSAVDFVAANSVLAIGNHPNCDKPFVQLDRTILENGTDLDRKLAVVVDGLALPLSLILEEHNVIPATGRADYDIVRPAQLRQEFEAIVLIGEVQDGLLQGLGGFHSVSH